MLKQLQAIKKTPKRMEYIGGQKHYYYDAAEIDFLIDRIIKENFDPAITNAGTTYDINEK